MTERLANDVGECIRDSNPRVEVAALEEIWFAAACTVVAAHTHCQTAKLRRLTQDHQFTIGRLGFWPDLAASLWLHESIRAKASEGSPFRATVAGDMFRRFDEALKDRLAAYENAIHSDLEKISQKPFFWGGELKERIRHCLFNGSNAVAEDLATVPIAQELLAGFATCVKMFANPPIRIFFAASFGSSDLPEGFWVTYTLPRQSPRNGSSE